MSDDVKVLPAALEAGHVSARDGAQICDICQNATWDLAFEALPDRLHNLAGQFNYWWCLSCGTLSLWPVPQDRVLKH